MSELVFRFAQPDWLWLLLLVPIAALLRGKQGRAAAVQFPAVGLARQVAAFVRSKPGRFFSTFRLVVLALVALAQAQPQLGRGVTEIEESGIDIVLAVDLSDSMMEQDFFLNNRRVDRLTAVKSVVDDFVEEREGDRIGLVAFALDPFLVSPITLNRDHVRSSLERLEFGLVDGRRTAIGEAIAVSANRLRPLDAESRVIVLLTDGESNTGIRPVPAASAAQTFGIRIYAIGVGREGPRSGTNFAELEEVAELTGGQFFNAQDTDTLADVYAQIDELEETEVTISVTTNYRDIFHYLIWAALALLALEQLLAATRFRRLP